MTDTAVADAPAAEAAQPEFANFTDPNAAPAAEAPKGEPAKGDEVEADGAPKNVAAKDDVTPEGDDRADAPKTSKQTAAERIAEVTRLRREAERDRDEARRELAELKKPKEDKPVPASDGEPDPATFDYGEADPKYIKALARFEAKQEFAEQSARERQRTQVQEVDRSWETAQTAARSKYADYDEVVTEGANDGKWPCTPQMAHAIKTSDTGPDVAYHLASNPFEARRIAALDPFSQIRELGKLEGRLTAPAPKEPPKGKTATDAPPPPDGQARGAGGKFTVSDDTDDFASFEAKHFRQT